MYLKVPTLEREYAEAALETRHYPIQYMTTEERALEVDIALPKGFKSRWLPDSLEIRNPHLEYSGTYEDRGDHILFKETFRRLQRIVPPDAYPEYRDALRSISEFSKQEIFLNAKG